MHELSVAGAVLETVRRHAGERRVTAVSLKVGGLRQVVPESLSFYWEIVTRDTACEDARLDLVAIDTRLRCSDCGRQWEPVLAFFRCEGCGSAEVSVLSGDELEVDYIEVEEPLEVACTAPR